MSILSSWSTEHRALGSISADDLQAPSLGAQGEVIPKPLTRHDHEELLQILGVPFRLEWGFFAEESIPHVQSPPQGAEESEDGVDGHKIQSRYESRCSTGQGWEMLMELPIQSPEFTYYTFFHPSLPINKDFSFWYGYPLIYQKTMIGTLSVPLLIDGQRDKGTQEAKGGPSSDPRWGAKANGWIADSICPHQRASLTFLQGFNRRWPVSFWNVQEKQTGYSEWNCSLAKAG